MSHLAVDELSILLLEPSPTQRKIIASRLFEAGNNNVELAETVGEAWTSMMKTHQILSSAVCILVK